MATIDVKDAAGATVALEKPLAPSRAAAALSRPVVLSTEDKTALDLIASAANQDAQTALLTDGNASLSQMPTEAGGNLAGIKTNTDDVSTDTTLNLVLAKLTALEGLYTTLADGVYVRLVNPADDTEVTYSDESIVRSSIFYVDVTLTLEPTILDAGDVAAATQVVAACTPGNDIPAILYSAAFIDPDDQKAACTFHFLSANVALGTEDAAPSITDGDAANWLGKINVAVADYVDLGGVAVAQPTFEKFVVKPATGTDDIYVAMTVVATPTYAGGAATLRLGFI